MKISEGWAEVGMYCGILAIVLFIGAAMSVRGYVARAVSVRMYSGDTIRIEYAAEKPLLSRLRRE